MRAQVIFIRTTKITWYKKN